MMISKDELANLLLKEQNYMDRLIKHFSPLILSQHSINAIRIGKRTELLANLQFNQLKMKG